MILSHPIRRSLALLAVPVLLGAVLSQTGSSAVMQAGNPGAEFFSKEVAPILEASCIACHTGNKPAGGLTLGGREQLLKGGGRGPAVTVSNLDDSLVLKAINFKGPQMPPSGRLPQKQIDVLTRWVKMGAPWPAEKGHAAGHGVPQVTPEAMNFWSFKPVRRPTVPKFSNPEFRIRNPIDAFVLAKLRKSGLKPSPPATKTALIRRAYYNLVGLPPSPEDVNKFVADKSPNAWEMLVDRLLASPQYGERWARHWLDLVRYAETNSYERDGHKPNAWRYRDYIINAFNQDKPYDRFIREQLAGDELPDRSPETLIATGYYRLGIWDDEPSDPKQALYDDLDDIASTTSQVFLGLTIGCARCHDHKIDPLPQKDYYRFLAFFAGVNRYGGPFGGNPQVSIAPEAEQAKYAAEVADHQQKVKAVQDKIEVIDKRIAPDLSPVEKEEWRNEGSHADIVKKRVPNLVSQDEHVAYVEQMRERRRLQRAAPRPLQTALAVTEDPQPRLTHVLLRGNPHVEGDVVEPGYPSVLRPPAPKIAKPAKGGTSGRRTALADWVASPANPLTARVFVNRVWQHQFGRGLVRTPSNFGFQGDPATHPELLDWLASEFMAGGWKVKRLQKLIMMSSTYQMSSAAQNSAGTTRAQRTDPENALMWRFDMRRLAAEELRDSLLAVNGSLNPKMGGQSIYTTIPKEVLAGQSRPGEGWGNSSLEEQRRRSIYVYVKRSLTVPIIASFDGAETDFSCPVRFATTQPTQALGTLNSAFINEQARALADYLRKNAGDDPAAQARLALWRTMQREPNQREIDRGVKLMTRLQEQNKVTKDEALTRFCVVALNLNEFLYLD